MASFREPGLLVGKKAAADLSSSQYKAVKQDASGDIVLAGAGEGIGFLMNAPTLGECAEVAVVGGGAKGEAAAAINEGAELASDASGNLVVAIATNIVLGIALNGAASGDIFEVMPTFYVK